MEKLPTVDLCGTPVSRLIAGANTINGGSHLSRFVNRQMKSYFTPERVLEHLTACEQAGVNTWQSGAVNLDLYRRHRDGGGHLHYILLGGEAQDQAAELRQCREYGVLGVAHHGELTDVLYKSGKLAVVRDYCRRVRDTGMAVGVSTHMPDVVRAVTDEGWDVDFFMACVYERHRSREELKTLLGHVPIPVSEVYLEEDPPRMFSEIRRTDKPCLAFKILAAGRLCDRQETVEEAFRQAFAQMKRNDAVIVGMYPEYEDQVALNAGYVRKYGA